jgi:hypothetical protein
MKKYGDWLVSCLRHFTLFKDLPLPTGIRVGPRECIDILERGKNSPPISPQEIESRFLY